MGMRGLMLAPSNAHRLVVLVADALIGTALLAPVALLLGLLGDDALVAKIGAGAGLVSLLYLAFHARRAGARLARWGVAAYVLGGAVLAASAAAGFGQPAACGLAITELGVLLVAL